jgi:UDP:flavonoid glycosyltransferase YjiC (YdhE family)
MKILYGINATGNGHISRARIIIAELKKRGHDISCIISGRNDDSLYDIEEFEPFVLKKGFYFQQERWKNQIFANTF